MAVMLCTAGLLFGLALQIRQYFLQAHDVAIFHIDIEKAGLVWLRWPDRRQLHAEQSHAGRIAKRQRRWPAHIRW